MTLEKIFNFLRYDNYYLFSAFFLFLITIVKILKISDKIKNRIYLILFILTILIFILWSLFLSVKQYYIWKNNIFSKYLLPPYQNITYYLNYSYFHFWRDFIFRLLGIFVVIIFMKTLSFLLKRDIFYDDEKILVPYFSLFIFFPYNIMFLFLGFFVLELVIIFNMIFKFKDNRYYSFRDFWIFLAWIVFLSAPFIFDNYKILQFKP